MEELRNAWFGTWIFNLTGLTWAQLIQGEECMDFSTQNALHHSAMCSRTSDWIQTVLYGPTNHRWLDSHFLPTVQLKNSITLSQTVAISCSRSKEIYWYRNNNVPVISKNVSSKLWLICLNWTRTVRWKSRYQFIENIFMCISEHRTELFGNKRGMSYMKSRAINWRIQPNTVHEKVWG